MYFAGTVALLQGADNHPFPAPRGRALWALTLGYHSSRHGNVAIAPLRGTFAPNTHLKGRNRNDAVTYPHGEQSVFEKTAKGNNLYNSLVFLA